MLKRITSNKIRLIFAAFLVFRLFLLNINYAEWGDSYRILRASEFIRSGSYPQDEKRQPVYSLMLAVRPSGIDPVLWGRIEMLAVSVAMFWMFYKIVQQLDLSKRARKIALWLLILNPVLLYWSIRIMADVPFAFLVLLTFYLYDRWKDSLTHKELFVLGLLVGLAVLTRFEGYILGFSLGLGVLLDQGWRFTIDDKLFNRAKKAATLLIGFLVVTLPWFLYRNPVNSTYFEEPSRRVYDLNVVHIYLVSSMFLFGFSSACYFFYKYRKELVNYSRKNVAITIFVIIELVLALIWPAAIPRLFTPVIPLLIIPLAVYVDKYFNSHEKSSFGDLLILVGLFLIFIISQYILRLQFLVLIKPLLVVVIGLQLINIFAIQKRNFCLFKTTLIFSMLVWSLSTIWLHKDIFKAVVKANKYVQNNLAGTIVYNDVSSVSDWYLNVKPGNDQVAGVYVNMDSRAGRTYEVLEEERADYIMVTNEHNTAMEFNADEVGYLEQITEFRYTIRGKEFFTKILKFNKYE